MIRKVQSGCAIYSRARVHRPEILTGPRVATVLTHLRLSNFETPKCPLESSLLTDSSLRCALSRDIGLTTSFDKYDLGTLSRSIMAKTLLNSPRIKVITSEIRWHARAIPSWAPVSYCVAAGGPARKKWQRPFPRSLRLCCAASPECIDASFTRPRERRHEHPIFGAIALKCSPQTFDL